MKCGKKFLALSLILCMVIPSVNVFATSSEAKGTNIALEANGTTISADPAGSWFESNNAGMAQLINGNSTGGVGITDWGIDYENKQIAITLQFNGKYRIAQTSLYGVLSRGGFPVDFTLQVENNGIWTTVVEKTNYQLTTDGEQAFPIEEVVCTGVRLVSTRNSLIDNSKYGILLMEFEVYGEAVTNIAHKDYGTTVSTTHPNSWAEIDMNGAYGIGNLNDGKIDRVSMTAALASYQNESISIELQLNGEYPIDEIRLYAADPSTQGGFPENFTLDVYMSSGWETVVTKTGYEVTEEGWQTFVIDEVECSAVRLSSTKNSNIDGGNKYGIYLYEFEVYSSLVKLSVPSLPEVQLADGDTLPTGYYENLYYIIGWKKDGVEATTFAVADADAYIPEYIELDMLDIAVQRNLSKENVYRFIASVDSTEKYQSSGFVFSNKNELPRIGGGNCIQKANSNNWYYLGIKAVLKAGEEATTKYVADLYGNKCENSSAIFIKAIQLQDAAELPTLYVCAYVILEDGTTVYGNVGTLSRTSQ